MTMSANNDGWKGYDLEQLRYQRLLNEVQRTVQREKIAAQFDLLRSGSGIARQSGFSVKAVAARIMGALNYADYIVLGVKLLRILRRLRRHKS
jgi:hypothetical protein